jgi:hypothetical protein
MSRSLSRLHFHRKGKTSKSLPFWVFDNIRNTWHHVRNTDFSNVDACATFFRGVLIAWLRCQNLSWTHCAPCGFLSCVVMTSDIYFIKLYSPFPLAFLALICNSFLCFLASSEDRFQYLNKVLNNNIIKQQKHVLGIWKVLFTQHWNQTYKNN